MTRIDRRALFASGAAAALLTATGLSPAYRPVEGGRLRLAVPRGDGSLDAVARGAVFDTLTEIAPDGVLRGELAVGWTGHAEARRWLFDLREGVQFHDGQLLSSNHVVAALSAGADRLPGAVRRIEATGPLQVMVELRDSDPQLPYRLADPACVISTDAGMGFMSEQSIGTGCYAMARSQPDRQFLGHKVAGHYKAGRAGWADSVEVVVIPDPAVRAEALRDGFVDIAALPAAEGLRGSDRFTFHPSAEDMALAASHSVGVPRVVGGRPLDDGRIAERWWLG